MTSYCGLRSRVRRMLPIIGVAGLCVLAGIWIRSIAIEDELAFRFLKHGIKVTSHCGAVRLQICDKPIWPLIHRFRRENFFFAGSPSVFEFGRSPPLVDYSPHYKFSGSAEAYAKFITKTPTTVAGSVVYGGSYYGFGFVYERPYEVNTDDSGRARLAGMIMPLYFPAILLATFVTIYFHRRALRNWRRRRGCCLSCGYDLRATLDRCPECGTQVPTAQMSRKEST